MAFITTPIFTRLLTQNEFGAYNNYISWMSIITIFVTLNLDSTLISAKFDFENDFDSYILSMLSLSALSAIAWGITSNLFKKFVESWLGVNIVYINIMILYLLFLPAINMYQARERYSFEYRKSVAASLILAISTSVLSIIMVLVMKNRLTGRILGMTIPTIVLGLFFYLFFIKNGKRIKFKYWIYALPICLPYIPHLLSLTVLNSTDRIMINKWCGESATALYSLAYTCGTIVNLFMISLNTAYAPWLGEKLNENKLQDIRNFSYIYILLFFVLSVGIILVSPEILYVLGGKEYAEATYILAPISMGCICQFLYTMFVNVEQFKRKTLGMALASISAALINILLNSIFIPKFGYIAAGYTTLAGYICLLLIHMYLVKRLNLSKIYDYRYIIFIVIVGLLLTVFITYLYSHVVVRYIVILFYSIGLLFLSIKNKEKILQILGRKTNNV